MKYYHYHNYLPLLGVGFICETSGILTEYPNHYPLFGLLHLCETLCNVMKTYIDEKDVIVVVSEAIRRLVMNDPSSSISNTCTSSGGRSNDINKPNLADLQLQLFGIPTTPTVSVNITPTCPTIINYKMVSKCLIESLMRWKTMEDCRIV